MVAVASCEGIKSIIMRIWITWEIQRRNRTISAQLNANLYEFNVQANGILRYCICVLKTCALFLKKKPSVIFAQSPSILLAALAVSWGRIFKVAVVIDAHNGGLFPFEGMKRWANKVVQYSMKRAALVIVSNQNLEKYVEAWGGKAFVLPDPIPNLANSADRITLKGRHNILFVCTYSEDEPYMEVIEAAKRLEGNIVLYITGNSKAKGEYVKAVAPPNVVLTGFLSEVDYIKMVYSVDVVLVLTTREDCLLCGSYEGIAAGKPLIITGTKVLREYAFKGAIYTTNDRDDIASKIHLAIADLNALSKEIKELKQERIVQWQERKILLESILANLV